MASVWPGSLQVSLRPKSSGRVRRTGQVHHIAFSRSLPYMRERSLKEECDERSAIIQEREMVVLGGHFIAVFILFFFFLFFFSESNFSAFADCQLSCLKDFHVSSFNSRSFDTDFFILLSLSSLMMLSWELLSLSSEGWECLDLDCFSPGTAFGFQFNNNNKSICELH